MLLSNTTSCGTPSQASKAFPEGVEEALKQRVEVRPLCELDVPV